MTYRQREARKRQERRQERVVAGNQELRDLARDTYYREQREKYLGALWLHVAGHLFPVQGDPL